MGEFARDRPDDTGYLQAPHGLWTIKVSTGARVLLGWLHSHSDAFLRDRVTERYARQVLATNSVSRWLVELETAGYITVERPGPRMASRFTLLMEPWQALQRRRPLAPNDASIWPQTRPASGLKRGHIEEQAGNHSEDQLDPPTPQGGNADGFAAWWFRYPRKIDRGKCERRWRRMSDSERSAAYAGLDKWLAFWERGEPDKVPHPSTWLNNQRWQADPPKPARRRGAGAYIDVINQLREEE